MLQMSHFPLCFIERPIYSSESDDSEGSGLDDSRAKRLTKAKRLEDSDDNVSGPSSFLDPSLTSHLWLVALHLDICRIIRSDSCGCL